jgi:hypothetical protein
MARIGSHEGDWFAVPLRDGGFSTGVVARSNSKGVVLGYFFGPRWLNIPSIDVVDGLKKQYAVLVAHFSYLGLRSGRWPILGRAGNWDRTQWSNLRFVRYEELSGRTFAVYYDDNDALNVVRELEIPSIDAANDPEDGLMGAGFVEMRLTKILGAASS